MFIAKPRRLFSFDFLFYQNGIEIGRLIQPWSYYFFDYGNAQAFAEDQNYEITYPRRAVTLLNSKEISMNLIYKGETIASVLPGSDAHTTERSTLKWKDQLFKCSLERVGEFVFTENNKSVGRIFLQGGIWSRTRVIEFTEGIPVVIQILAFFGVLKAKATQISC